MKTNPTDLPPYLTEPRYLRELAPLHAIDALEDAKGDPEFATLRDELVNAMLRFRDKLADRPVPTTTRGGLFYYLFPNGKV